MNVSEAVISRRSVRAFLDRPPAPALLRQVLAQAARAPSGCNLQPWRLFVLGGDELVRFKASFRERLQTQPEPDSPEYPMLPARLVAPYDEILARTGEGLYGAMGVERDDKTARQRFMALNFEFFGAPTGLFCYVDRTMGAAQWSDLGMYLQTLMLLLKEQGLDSCAQECWSLYHRTLDEFLAPPKQWMLFCGMAIGYADPAARANTFASERLPLEQFATFRGI